MRDTPRRLPGRDSRRVSSTLGVLMALTAPAPAADLVRAVSVPADGRPLVLQGTLQGARGESHRLQARAGQTLVVRLDAQRGSPEYIVRIEGAAEAMHRSEIAGPQARLTLPDDGTYVVTAFLMRSAARRNERAEYTLSLALQGSGLPALPAARDALVPGTRFHARAAVRCVPPYASAEAECQAGVVRRGHDGTASVEIRGPNALLRHLLFVRGEAVGSDAGAPLRQRLDGDVHVIEFEGGEVHRIPQPLLGGG